MTNGCSIKNDETLWQERNEQHEAVRVDVYFSSILLEFNKQYLNTIISKAPKNWE